ncbi:probable LRR receptor-like serine/threonine-protein kinase At4g36180 [Gossypium arboreum]|uniref:probable LRR receptor-like serine/threonine-protein kinase At4g36180 n=1 Tax=Gossypium arboreum TaxID=29729 RepID=UPI00081920F9|nr:probable LRR receptor-like serine/threonine-protein kinase At4g36180 [Gossypium arboreum]
MGVLDRFSACQNNSLEILYLGGNYLVGSLPQSLGTLRNLQELDLNTNFFWGSNPASIGNLSSLEFLELSDNNLNGTIPESFWRLAKLSTVSLESNQMEGPSFPVWLLVQTNLSYVIVSNAGISDIVEEEWLARLSGQLPDCWNKLRSLKVVDASNNSLSGEIPSSLTSLCHLILLMLGDNNLHNDIPLPPNSCRQFGSFKQSSYWVNSENFTALKFGNRSLDYEELFDLQNGTINEQMMLVKNIDLSENNLIGEFPKGICRLAFLDTLNLSTNYLSGNIPDNIGDMRWLESLDLSVNNFSGPIPSSLSSLTLLNHLKLSYNLSERIPTGYQLQTLNDSSNYEGNLLLCRVPLLTRCPEDINSPPTSSSLGGSKDKLWLYLSITMGYIVGFWGVCGTLVMKESWRQAYFQYVDELKEKLLLWIALTVARS